MATAVLERTEPLRVHPERAESLQAYPNITMAATMLGVSPATVSRRKDLVRERRGERELALAPVEVMRLAAIYRKRSLNEVAQALVDYAEQHALEQVEKVEEEIENFIAARREPPADRQEFLASAKQLLPRDVYDLVEKTLVAGKGRRPRVVAGYTPR